MMIELDANDSMLLLITKNWHHKKVESIHPIGSMEYIWDCVDVLTFGAIKDEHKSDLFSIYIELCANILSSYAFAEILIALYTINPFNVKLEITRENILQQMIAKLSTTRTDNLILDESLVELRSE